MCRVHNCASHSTNKQQGSEVMDDSVKKWWSKVVAVAGATDIEQAILDFEGLMYCVSSLINLRLNGRESLNRSLTFHIVSHHTMCHFRM